jgi:glutathione S-transferase
MAKDVDTSLYPYTTGAAALLAAEHSAQHALKLYGGWFCPFVQRAWIVLCEKNIDHQYVEINPYKKDPEFLALNPRGLVPTLEVPVGKDGEELRPLYESIVICEYLDEAHADEATNGPALLPADPYQRARCRMWIDHINSKIVPGFYKLLQHTPEKEYTIHEARANLHQHIKTFARELINPGSEDGPWFLGRKFSMVDVSLAPWAMRLWLIDHYKTGGLGIPLEGQGGEDESVWLQWRRWMGAISERRSVRNTLSEGESYITVYKRYAEDTTQSQVGQATRKGQRLP